MRLNIQTSLESLFKRNGFGIYVHIPFCIRRCRYCAFVSSVPHLVPEDAYVKAVIREFGLRYPEYAQFSLKTLYFGGGTPTMLTDAAIGRIIDCIRITCGTPDEMTLEANPEHVTAERCKMWRQLGFTRISLGIQSFDDAMLQFLGRGHNASQAISAIETLYDAGFEEISIDLIYGGLPNPDDLSQPPLKTWQHDLETAKSYHPAHVSCYELTLEPHTPLWTCQKRKMQVLCDESTIAEMMSMIPDALGMTRYEISNYSRDNYFSAHNLSCWAGMPYLGLGAAAHSLNTAGHQYSRRANTADIRQYIKSADAAEGILPQPEFTEILSPQAHLAERLMCAARTRLNFNPQGIADQIGATIAPYLHGIHKAIERGLLEERPDGCLRTTNQGILLNNMLDSLIFEGYETT